MPLLPFPPRGVWQLIPSSALCSPRLFLQAAAAARLEPYKGQSIFTATKSGDFALVADHLIWDPALALAKSSRSGCAAPDLVKF